MPVSNIQQKEPANTFQIEKNKKFKTNYIQKNWQYDLCDQNYVTTKESTL